MNERRSILPPKPWDVRAKNSGHCSTWSGMHATKVYLVKVLGTELVKIGIACLQRVHVHLHEVVLDPAFFGGGEDLFPVDGTLSHRHHFLVGEGPVHQMHRSESAGILLQHLRGVEAEHNDEDL